MRLKRRSRRRGRDRISHRSAGLLGIVLLLVVAYGATTKFANPLASQYTAHAVLPSSGGLLKGSLVRIAGVNVGTVTSVQPPPGCSPSSPASCQAADVTMQIQSSGLPLHTDATFAVRPRIFLEGNFFVDISPGRPAAPVAPADYTFPIQQGSTPVQLDQVLSSLPSATRQNLQVLLDQYGQGVFDSGAAYNASIKYWLPAYKYTGIVSRDALGIKPRDLSNWIAQGGSAAAAFNAHPQRLESLISGFDTAAGSFAREHTALAAAVSELPRTLATATPALNALNTALPPLERLSHALLPGVKTSGHTIDVSLPFMRQLRQLVAPSELRGLSTDLRATVPALTRLTERTIPLMRSGVRPVASCVSNVIYPWSRLTLDDHTLSGTRGLPLRKVYVEAVDFLPGLAGESRALDANGPYIRVLGNGGTLTYSLQPGMFGQSLAPLSAVQPQLPPSGRRPPLQSRVPCETQAPIRSLDAPPSPPLKQLPTNLSAPGASVRWKSAAQAALAMITGQAKQQGLAVKVSQAVKSVLSR